MKYFEIVNPSDPYTISGEDEIAAVVANLCLGQGMYALIDEKGESIFPITFNGTEELFKEVYGYALDDYIKGHYAEIATALDSVVIGSMRDRLEYDETVAALADDKRADWIAKREDKRRSSMNNIGKRAAAYAESLWERVAGVKP